MSLAVVDRYLLGDPVQKQHAVDALLAAATTPAAAPFARGLQAVGVRAADEALVALRIVLAGRAPDDVAVRRVRALSGVARACAQGDARALASVRKRDGSVLADLPVTSDLAALAQSARAAYAAELV
jgi:hypothetical protein